MTAWLLWLVALSPQTSPQAMPHLKTCSEALRKGAARDAVDACKAAVSIDPKSAAAHLLLGQAYLALRNASMVAEAKAELQQALDIDPKLVWGRFYLAKVYIDTGRPDKAKTELEEGLRERPGVPHLLSMLGEAERKLGHPEAALDWHRKALAADPKLNTAHYYAALAYMDLKRDDEAIGELEASVRSPYVAPELYLTLGSLYAQRKRYREAEEVCRKGIAIDPERSEGYLNLAQLFNAQKMSDKALAALRQAMPEGKTFATSPYYQRLQADIHFEAGRAWADKGKTREAIQAYTRSLAFDEGRAAAHRNIAAEYRKTGNTAAAIQHEEEAARLEAKGKLPGAGLVEK